MCYYTSEETLSVLTCACNVQYKSYALKIQHDYNNRIITALYLEIPIKH